MAELDDIDEPTVFPFPGNGTPVSWRELELVMKPMMTKLDTMDKKLNVLTADWFENRGAQRERRRAAEKKDRFHHRWYGRVTLAFGGLAAIGAFGFLITYLWLTLAPPPHR